MYFQYILITAWGTDEVMAGEPLEAEKMLDAGSFPRSSESRTTAKSWPELYL